MTLLLCIVGYVLVGMYVLVLVLKFIRFFNSKIQDSCRAQWEYEQQQRALIIRKSIEEYEAAKKGRGV